MIIILTAKNRSVACCLIKYSCLFSYNMIIISFIGEACRGGGACSLHILINRAIVSQNLVSCKQVKKNTMLDLVSHNLGTRTRMNIKFLCAAIFYIERIKMNMACEIKVRIHQSFPVLSFISNFSSVCLELK